MELDGNWPVQVHSDQVQQNNMADKLPLVCLRSSRASMLILNLQSFGCKENDWIMCYSKLERGEGGRENNVILIFTGLEFPMKSTCTA